MKIRVAILDKDEGYLNRIVSVFSTRYADKLELYSFTDLNVAISNLLQAKIDVFLANDIFDVDESLLPNRCGFAYFVDSPDLITVRDQRAVCKYQKADLIYKQILNIYAEHAGNVSGLKLGNDTARVILFTPVSGGAGASTSAAACSMHFAAQGKSVLYLNLEKMGSADMFFKAEGQFDMSDVIFALKNNISNTSPRQQKNNSANLALKLESSVRQDTHGVYFFAQSKNALDMIELNSEDTIRLLKELQFSGKYHDIILDCDFSLDSETLKIWKQAHSIVWVGDGSEYSNYKLRRGYEALRALETSLDIPLINRVVLFYNKFGSNTGKKLDDIGIKEIGGSRHYKAEKVSLIVEQMSVMNEFDRI